MTSFNNNHAMDFSFDGLLATLRAVDESGLVHSGVGRNLGEASASRYLETVKGRVALISVNSSLAGQMSAGEQTPRIKGRPGVNPLRTTQKVDLEEEDYIHLSEIIRKTGINAAAEISKREGYRGGVTDEQKQYIDRVNFYCSDKTDFKMEINKADLARVEKSIREAQLQAYYIVISVHSHQIEGFEKETPAGFLKEFAHFCIDKGAHAIIGHGPHLLRPIEVYKKRPIFYSLGDFILQLYNVEFAPEEFYSQYNLTSRDTVHELLKARSKNFTRGLMTDKRMFVSVIPCWEMEDGELVELVLYPILLSMDGKKSEIGLPRLCTEPDLLSDFIRRCEAFGTRLVRREDGAYECILD